VHETLISADEARRVVEFKDMYVIEPAYSWWLAGDYLKEGKLLPDGFVYTSDRNDQWLSMQELQRMIGI
jgi:UDP-N-acetylglucosamine 4,6-dehydratase